jgi:hypothetical protein
LKAASIKQRNVSSKENTNYLPDGTGENQEKSQDSAPGRHLNINFSDTKQEKIVFPFYTQGVEISILMSLVDSEYETRYVENQGTLKDLLLGVFVELRKAIISFAVSFRPLGCPHETRCPLDEFSRNFISKYFSTNCRGITSFIKIEQE